jgi:hypothetical protein
MEVERQRLTGAASVRWQRTGAHLCLHLCSNVSGGRGPKPASSMVDDRQWRGEAGVARRGADRESGREGGGGVCMW